MRGNKVLGEKVHTQSESILFGGVLPPFAQDFHRKHIEPVVEESLKRANVNFEDLDAIAVTNRPGINLSLSVGVRYAKHLARRYQKPLIPIHHMEAHALTARMERNIEFPFLCLLISGGHSLLAIVHDVDDFSLLGETVDDAPGEAFDKIARRLKLRNLPKFEHKNGGQAIEEAALTCGAITDKYKFPLLMARHRDCQFSFAGIKNSAKRFIQNEELSLNLDADLVIPDYPDLCANFLGGITRHLCHKTQRAIEFCERKEIFKDVKQKTLVVSGGVACNDFINIALSQLCGLMDFKAYRPSKKLCTDNGVMIAWNGVERFETQKGIYPVDRIDEIPTLNRCMLGKSLIDEVKDAGISCKWAKIPILQPFRRAGK